MQLIKKDESTNALKAIPVAIVSSTDLSAITGYSLTAANLKISKGGTGSEATCAGTLTELAGGDYYYLPTAGEVDTLGILRGRLTVTSALVFRFATEVVAFNPFVVIPTLRDVGELERSTSRATTNTTIQLKAGTVTPQPGAMVEILTGTFAGFIGNYSSYNAGTETLTFDPPCVGLTGTPDYKLLSAAGAPTNNPIDVDLSDAAVTKVWTQGSLSGFGAGTAAKTLSNLTSTGDVVLASTEPGIIADAILNRNIRGGSASGRRVHEAIAFLRNKWIVNKDAVPPTFTVYDQDDTTVLWTGILGTSALFDSVVTFDPS